jgi:hypothetical protein
LDITAIDEEDTEVDEVDSQKKGLAKLVPPISTRVPGSNNSTTAPSTAFAPGSVQDTRQASAQMMREMGGFFAGKTSGGAGGTTLQTEASEVEAKAKIVAAQAAMYDTFTRLMNEATDPVMVQVFKEKAEAALNAMTS